MIVTRRRLEDGDFEAWKVRFEQGSAARKQAGCRGVRRFVGVEDRHELMIIFDWDSYENAWKFINEKVDSNPKLSERMSVPKLSNIAMEEIAPLES